VGIGFNWTFHHFRADFYWAHPIKDPPEVQHDDIQDEGIHFQVWFDAF
jgi:hemolysin activation/secretion protein